MKNYILAAIVATLSLAAAFSIGRYTAPKINTTVTDTTVDKDVHTEVTETKQPDGTVIRVTKRDTTTKSDTKTKNTTAVGTQAKLHVLGLVGYDFGSKQPVYGALISKQLLGPLEIGVFGTTNSTFTSSILGVAVGLGI